MEFKNPKIALWATNLEKPISDIDDWLLCFESEVKKAVSAGADIFMAPEYVSEQWLHFAPKDLVIDDEMRWQSTHAAQALKGIINIATQHNISILAGTWPVMEKEVLHNRAHFITPDGSIIIQDKICLTPNERMPKSVPLRHGNKLKIFKWQGWNLAILICLDSEIPALSSLLLESHQKGQGVDMILCPSMTSLLSGHSRVHSCCKARAIELMAAVATVGVVNSAKKEGTHMGSTAIYLPCEAMLESKGILCKTAAADKAEGAGTLTISPMIDLRRIKRARSQYAEVWSGNIPKDLKGETTILDLPKDTAQKSITLPDNIIIHLLGMAGTGKYTIGSEIARLTKAQLIDNHYINNPIFNLIALDGKTLIADEIWEEVHKIRAIIFNIIAHHTDKKSSYILTNELYAEDADDIRVVKMVQDLAKKRGATYIPIRLTCTIEELCQRVIAPQRIAMQKATCPNRAREKHTSFEIIKTGEKTEFTLDVTKLSAKEAATAIIEKLSL